MSKDDDLKEIQKEIESFINKYNITEFKVNIYKLYNEKIISLKIE